MEGLLKISGCENPNAIGDVVFVHGLDGDARETWHPKGKPSDFWPAWVGEDLGDLAVWSLGYEVSASAWKGNTTMPLVDRATNVLAMLQTQALGRRPLVFICHSLGGLLVKQMLRHARDFGDPAWEAIRAQTKGIVFLSTPHSGANIASWLKYIGTLLRTTVSVEELEAHHPRLRELNTWYRNNASSEGIKTLVFCEKLKVARLLVVDETTADPGIPGVNPIPMDDDHISICKPASKDTMLYLRTKQFIMECTENTPIRSGPAHSTLPSAAPKQKPLRPIDPIRYEERFRKELEKAFSNERLQPAARLLRGDLEKVSPQEAVKELLKSDDGLNAVQDWNRVIAELLHDPGFGQSALRNVWSACEEVHLLLLPRLVNSEWLAACNQGDGDQMLFSLSIRHDPPNRVVDLIFACLDKKNTIRFEHCGKANERDLAVPKYQIDVTNEGLKHSPPPDPTHAVERVGLRLWEEYGLGKPTPERMHKEHWEDLDAKLKAVRYTQRLFYLVIPEGNIYADRAILRGLYENLPNLPKFLLLAPGGSPSPFHCKPKELSAAIGEFWYMKPTENP